MQVLSGPRQVGKTTMARQVMDASGLPGHYASADDPTIEGRLWIEAQWNIGRVRARGESGRGALLVLDEIQKIPGWSDVVKRLWDEDTASDTPLRIMLLGSATLLVERGLSESLAGRFELVRLTHWSLAEMRAAFGWDVDRYVYFGGYPGAAALVDDQPRWAQYVRDSLIETTISRDVLLMSRVAKPALLRQLFGAICDYSGQIVSYQKLLGQLQDAGNVTTLAHYLELLNGAGLAIGLQRFSGARIRRRGSIPKLLVLNTALMSAVLPLDFSQALEDRTCWGRLVESAVGAHLVNLSTEAGFEVFYWRSRSEEVDFVLKKRTEIVGIEVASGILKDSRRGVSAFERAFPGARTLLVGGQGIPLAEFLDAAPGV